MLTSLWIPQLESKGFHSMPNGQRLSLRVKVCVLECSDSTEDKLSPRKDSTHTESWPNEEYTKNATPKIAVWCWDHYYHSGQARNSFTAANSYWCTLESEGCECTQVKSITEEKSINKLTFQTQWVSCPGMRMSGMLWSWKKTGKIFSCEPSFRNRVNLYLN